jgi:predicted nucleotide-binding protein
MKIFDIELDEQEQDFLLKIYEKSCEETGRPDLVKKIKMFDAGDKEKLGIARTLKNHGLITPYDPPTGLVTFQWPDIFKASDDSFRNGMVIITQKGVDYTRELLKYRSDSHAVLNALGGLSSAIQRVIPNSSQKPETVRKSTRPPSSNIFVAHGHDDRMKKNVVDTLKTLDLNPIVLRHQASQGRTIIEKLTEIIEEKKISFAVVLFSPDDKAHAKNESPDSARFRARQNVILELGYCMGKLERRNVAIIQKKKDNFEIPSDCDGIVRILYYRGDAWKHDLVTELKKHGYTVDANKLYED